MWHPQGITAYKTDLAWLSWLALVDDTMCVQGDCHDDASIIEMDNKIIAHRNAFRAVRFLSYVRS